MERKALRWITSLLALLFCGSAAFAVRPNWVKVCGTAWRIPVTFTVDLGAELGEFVWPDVDSTLTFGPKGRTGKSKFVWDSREDNHDGDLYGTFKPEKNRVTMTFTKSEWTSMIKDGLKDMADERDVDLSDLSVKLKRFDEFGCETGRDRQGEWIEFALHAVFEYSFKMDGRRYRGVGSFEMDGTGRH